MMLKKIIAAAAAIIIAFGVCTCLPVSTDNSSVLAITAEAANSDFTVVTNDGYIFITEYKGKDKNVVIPTDKTYNIAVGAFSNNTTIESVTIGSNVHVICAEAFLGCTNLKSVKFTGSKDGYSAKIGGFAFAGCDNLTNVDFGERNIVLGSNAFTHCKNLTSLTLGKNVNFYDFDIEGQYYGISSFAVGYAYDSDKETSILADGKTTAVIKLKNGDEIKTKQKAITLYVEKDSIAESYAQDNGIAYKYGKAPASSTATTNTKSNSTNSSKLAAPTGIKATVSEEKIVLNWNKVSGAKAYRVYKYDSKTGKYLKYKDVSGTKCTVTGLKSGTKYSFKIYALTSENGKFVPQTPSKAVAFTTKEYNIDLIIL